MAEIRPARPDDLPSLREVLREAFRPYIPRMGREPAPVTADHAGWVADGQARLAIDAGEVLGVLVLLSRPDHLLLDTLAVHPRAQGRGLGRLLLEEAEAVARSRGLPTIRLYTNEAMTENLGLYRRFGYEETHRAVEDGFRRIHMAKALG